MITSSITCRVPDDEMKQVYGLSDGCISAFSSGGLEYHNVQSLLCGKPLACTNYSCGEDFCEQDFVYKLSYTTYTETGTNFIKSTTDIGDMKKFMHKVWRMPKRDLALWGEKGRAWAVKTFGIETIGAQWEKLIDAMPIPDWETIDLTIPAKNDKLPFPEITSDTEFIKTLYTQILSMNEPEDGSGFKYWMEALRTGKPRAEIYNFFVDTARKENAKNSAPQQDFSTMLTKNGRKRGLILIKESIGDVLLVTSLFKSFHAQHPDTDLYVMAEGKYHMLLEGNPHVHKILEYLPPMEQEMIAMGAGQKEGYFDYYYHAAIQTQRLLSYLSQPKPAFDLTYA
jgi:hypothetical protein